MATSTTTTARAPIPAAPLDPAYRLVLGPPSVAAYVTLRQTPGLTPKSEAQAAAGIDGAWFAVHAVHIASGATVAMCRVLGDGGWYFHIIDLATAAAHQRRGLGAALLACCLEHIRDHAPPNAFVTLLADPPGRKLYQRFGFGDTAPASIGMSRQS